MNKSDWWKRSVIYQIYPQSYRDTNGDGIGDLPGITQSLPYLKQLGIDAIWLSPIFASPLVDNGYDISDYYAINPQYGTLDDFKVMLKEAHRRNIRIVMDLVVNHTSDQSKWFKESCKSKDNKYSDYYIWHDPQPDGSAPNNWGSAFGGSAWEYVPKRNQYYLHLFAPQQPDLNWENPAMRHDIYQMMRYWFDMGIDGFRMDSISLISKKPDFPDAPVNGGHKYGSFYFGAANGPRLHEFLHEMYIEVLSHYDIITIGETPHTSAEQALLITDPQRQELNMVFQFDHMHVDYGEYGRYSNVQFKLSDLRASMTHWQKVLEDNGWNSLYWDNHDQPRVVSRFGDDGKYRDKSAKMLATILHLQKGTPYIYQGEEIGMTNVYFKNIEQYRDIETKNFYSEKKQQGLSEAYIMEMIQRKSRDNARSPMQWNDTVNAGFSSGKPWIDVNPNYTSINVRQALADKNSIFYFYKKLIELRKHLDVVVNGSFNLINPDDSAVFGYTRKLGTQILVVIGSFVNQKVRFTLPFDLTKKHGKLLLSNYDDSPSTMPATLFLKPYEGVVYLIDHG